MIGKIRIYKEEHGWGYLVTRNSKQVWFHISQWREEEIPVTNDVVEFEIGPSKRDGYPPEAKDIRKVGAILPDTKKADQKSICDEAADILARPLNGGVL